MFVSFIAGDTPAWRGKKSQHGKKCKGASDFTSTIFRTIWWSLREIIDGKPAVFLRRIYYSCMRRRNPVIFGDLAKMCCKCFCHSDSASRIDTNQWNLVKIRGTEIPHEPRIWEATTVNEKIEKFLDSIEYKTHLATHPHATICRLVFSDNLCPCVRDPTPQSCVDEKKPTVDEFAKGIWSVFLHDKYLKCQLESCQCPTHLEMRATEENHTSPSKPSFEQLMISGHLDKKSASTTCLPVFHSNLHLNFGLDVTRISKFVKWKCRAGTCADCGVERNLLKHVYDCPILSNSKKGVHPYEWRA